MIMKINHSDPTVLILSITQRPDHHRAITSESYNQELIKPLKFMGEEFFILPITAL